jgi:hypothetical protein
MLPPIRHICLQQRLLAAPKIILARPFITNAHTNLPNKQKAEKQNEKQKLKEKEPETMDIRQKKTFTDTIRSIVISLQDKILFNRAFGTNSRAKKQKDPKNPSKKTSNPNTPPAGSSDKHRNQIKNFGKALGLPKSEANRLPHWVYIHTSPNDRVNTESNFGQVGKLTPVRNEAAHSCSGDEIMMTWPYRDNDGKKFVEALFPKGFDGVQLKDWKAKATSKQKRKRISSCELPLLLLRWFLECSRIR